MRIRNVIAMHFTHRMQAFGWPLLIAAFALVIVLAIGAIVLRADPSARAGMTEGMRFNGAVFTLLGPLIGYGFTSMSSYFPLALGMGITRREFAAGLSLVFLGNAIGYSALITLGKAVEVATGGFGLGVRFFDTAYTSTGAVWQTAVQTFLLLVLVTFLGAAITAAFLRLGQSLFWTGGAILASLAVIVIGAMVLHDGFRRVVFDLFTMSWGSWMGVIAVASALVAAVWLVLLRRTQVQ